MATVSETAKTIPAEFIARVNFGEFWAHYLDGPSIYSLDKETLEAAKQALLDAGVPPSTARYYFIELGGMVACTVNSHAVQILIEQIQDELSDLI